MIFKSCKAFLVVFIMLFAFMGLHNEKFVYAELTKADADKVILYHVMEMDNGNSR